MMSWFRKIRRDDDDDIKFFTLVSNDWSVGLAGCAGAGTVGDESRVGTSTHFIILYVLFFFLLVSEKKQGSRGHISLFTETKNTTGWGFLAFRFPSLKLAPNIFFS